MQKNSSNVTSNLKLNETGKNIKSKLELSRAATSILNLSST